MRRAVVGAVVALAMALAGCRSFDERAGHRCGDSPDAVCAQDDGEPVEETPTEPAVHGDGEAIEG